MQNKCLYYSGNEKSDECHGCIFLENVDDLLGVCKCPHNKKVRYKNLFSIIFFKRAYVIIVTHYLDVCILI